MSEEKRISEEVKALDKEQLGEVGGGAVLWPRCKKCARQIAPTIHAKNNGYCNACKPEGGGEGGC